MRREMLWAVTEVGSPPKRSHPTPVVGELVADVPAGDDAQLRRRPTSTAKRQSPLPSAPAHRPRTHCGARIWPTVEPVTPPSPGSTCS